MRTTHAGKKWHEISGSMQPNLLSPDSRRGMQETRIFLLGLQVATLISMYGTGVAANSARKSSPKATRRQK